jgi:hypothetical protein
MARALAYTQEKGDRICELLVEGRSLRSICAGEKGMPSAAVICRWLAEHEDFRRQYARAREAQADSLVDETLDIVDDGRNDWMEIHSKAGESLGYKLNGEAISRSKLRVEQRRWLAARLAPKKYGDKAEVATDAVDSLQVLFDAIRAGTA